MAAITTDPTFVQLMNSMNKISKWTPVIPLSAIECGDGFTVNPPAFPLPEGATRYVRVAAFDADVGEAVSYIIEGPWDKFSTPSILRLVDISDFYRFYVDASRRVGIIDIDPNNPDFMKIIHGRKSCDYRVINASTQIRKRKVPDGVSSNYGIVANVSKSDMVDIMQGAKNTIANNIHFDCDMKNAAVKLIVEGQTNNMSLELDGTMLVGGYDSFRVTIPKKAFDKLPPKHEYVVYFSPQEVRFQSTIEEIRTTFSISIAYGEKV